MLGAFAAEAPATAQSSTRGARHERSHRLWIREVLTCGLRCSEFEEKGAPYRLHALELGEEKTPAHLARHPFGRVPTIDHDGFALYETQAIIRYVDAAFAGPALQPRDAQASARMNQLIGIVDWYFFHQVTAVIGFNRLLAPLLGITTDEAAVTADSKRKELPRCP